MFSCSTRLWYQTEKLERMTDWEMKKWKNFERLVQLLRAQAKATITFFVVGGIDVLANILIPTLHVVISLSVDPLAKVYIKQFFLYPLKSSLLLLHPLVYGLYMSKIRKRLPLCTVCERQWKICRSKVVTLHRQPWTTML